MQDMSSIERVRDLSEQTTLSVTRTVHSCPLLDFGNQDDILTDPWFSEESGYFHGEPLGMEVKEL
jgi:hypothetical protein